MASPSTPVLLVQDRPVGSSMDVRSGSGSSGSSRSGMEKGKGKVSTLGTKLLASTTGAVMTASLMTPCDVLKTRMQTSPPVPITSALSSSTSTSTSTPTSTNRHARFPTSRQPISKPPRSTPTTSSHYRYPTHPHLRPAQDHPPFFQPHRFTLGLVPNLGVARSGGYGVGSGMSYAPRLSTSTSTSTMGMGIGAGEMPIRGSYLDINLNTILRPPSYTRLDLVPSTITATPLPLSSSPSSTAAAAATRQTILSEIKSILSESGLKGLWRGTGTAVLQSIPSAGIYMVGYDYLVGVLTPLMSPSGNRNRNKSKSPGGGDVTGNTGLNAKGRRTGGDGWVDKGGIPFTAGCLARIVSASVVGPLELFRVRLQARPLPGQSAPTYSSTLSTILSSISHSGPSTLYRGLTLTLLRDVPFSGAYWVVFEGIRRRVVEARPISPVLLDPKTTTDPSGLKETSKLTLGETFVAGATSGMVAALITQPFDVLKTRKQVLLPSVPATSVSQLHIANLGAPVASAAKPKGMSIPGHLVHIARTEGVKALFSGVGPRVLKIAPACGMMLGCYEGVGRFFGEGR